MIPKRLFIATLLISLFSHMAILALTGFSEMNIDINGDRVFKVHLEKEPKDLEEKREKRQEAREQVKREEPPEENIYDAEDTVNLDSTDTKYYPYLVLIKSMIERKWAYPRQAFASGEKGTAIVEFSITFEGLLSDISIISSSGYESLDGESIHAVESSAPFPRLPESFQLSRLNIVAEFNYTLSD